MPGIQSAIALVGAAKQTAHKTAAAAPTFGHGVKSGQVFNVEYEQGPEDLTSSKRIAPHANRESVMGAQSWTSRLFPGAIGMWLHAALGAVATTGTGPYVHEFVPADDLPYLTLFGKHASNIYSVQDAKVDELTLSWSESQPPEVSMSAMGTVIGFPADFTPDTDESLVDYLHTAGGTFQMEVAGDTPAAAVITGGEITIANNLEPIRKSGQIVPDDVFPGRHDFTVSLTLKPQNMDDWRKALTGSAAGTTPSEFPVYGSFLTSFVRGTNVLELTSPRVAFLADFPDANPSGGAAEITLEGVIVQPTDGTTPALKATLTNEVTAY